VSKALIFTPSIAIVGSAIASGPQPLPVPGLKHHQTPKQMTMVGDPLEMLHFESLNRSFMEDALRPHLSRIQQVIHQGAKGVHQPVSDWNSETPLRAKDTFTGHVPGRHFLQQVLGGETPYFEMTGHP
jgi:hypothetical protein